MLIYIKKKKQKKNITFFVSNRRHFVSLQFFSRFQRVKKKESRFISLVNLEYIIRVRICIYYCVCVMYICIYAHPTNHTRVCLLCYIRMYTYMLAIIHATSRYCPRRFSWSNCKIFLSFFSSCFIFKNNWTILFYAPSFTFLSRLNLINKLLFHRIIYFSCYFPYDIIPCIFCYSVHLSLFLRFSM